MLCFSKILYQALTWKNFLFLFDQNKMKPNTHKNLNADSETLEQKFKTLLSKAKTNVNSFKISV